MPIDTSFYNTKAPETYNPLKTLSDVTAISNAMQQNKLLQIQQQRDTIGVDQAKVALTKDQYDLGMKQYAGLNKIMADLPPNPTQDDIIKAAVNARVDGLISQEQLNRTVADVPSDPAKIRAYTDNMRLRLLDGQTQLEQLYGKNIEIDTGSQKGYGVQQSPMMGGRIDIASAVDKELTPQDNATLVEVRNPRGEPILTSKGEIFTPTGQRVAPGMEKYLDNAGDDDTSKSPPPSPPELKTGFAPGTEELAAIGARELGSDISALNRSTETLFNMEQAMEALNKAPTGKGSEYRNAIKAFATTIAPERFKDTDWQNDVTAYAKAEKYLANQARANAAMFGPNTNQNLATAATGTPNTSIDNLAAKDLQKVGIGLTRLNFARTAAFQAENPEGTPQEYQKYGSKFNKEVDPRGFMVDQMPKTELKRLLESMPKGSPERKKFDNAYNMAVQYGFMNHIGMKK